MKPFPTIRPAGTSESRAPSPSAALASGWPQIVAMLEPTFHADKVDAGHFDLGGRRVRLVLEPEGWLMGWTPLSGGCDRWIARQTRVQTAAKIVSGPALRVDMPIAESPAGSGTLAHAVTALTRVLREALAFMTGDDSPMAAAAPSSAMSAADRAVIDMLHAYATSSPWPVSDEAGGWTLLVETAVGAQRINARARGGRLRFTARLVRQQPCEPAARAAVAHFLLALNEHIRLARGTVGDAGVLVEVVVPAWSVSSGLIDRAVGALIVAAAVAKRECAALMDPAVAAAFCAFHQVGAAHGVGAADEPIFGPHEERSAP